ncbi:MAG TPA: hypothetical protein VN029_02495 [Sphingomonas sp.]|nr:hypothetical protein [Sphingomonas sp.]
MPITDLSHPGNPQWRHLTVPSRRIAPKAGKANQSEWKRTISAIVAKGNICATTSRTLAVPFPMPGPYRHPSEVSTVPGGDRTERR